MRSTYANVVATLALVVAVGGSGTALAAGHLPRNSVVSKTIKNGSIQGKDLKDGSITAADLAPGTLPAAPRVVAGPVLNEGGTVFTETEAQAGRVTVTAPAAGYVELTGQVVLKASAKSLYVRVVFRDGTTVLGGQQWGAGTVTGNYNQAQTGSVVVPVTAGTHDYTMGLTDIAADNTHSSWAEGQLIAAYFPAP